MSEDRIFTEQIGTVCEEQRKQTWGMLIYHVYRRDNQRHVVLSRFISARTEEGVDVLSENIVERVDVDFGINVVKRYLQGKEKTYDIQFSFSVEQ